MKKNLIVLTVGLLAPLAVQSEPFREAEVTKTVNSVSLLRTDKAPKPAEAGDRVSGRTAVKTGADSRAELQFPDRTITRIGANALFRFREGGREMTLDGGTMLFSSPKGAGGGEVQAGAVTAAVTGTNFLLYYLVGGDVKIVVLEGKVIIFLTANPSVRQVLRAGEIGVFPAGGSKFQVFSIDLKRLISTSRLLESGGFDPLPVMPLLLRVADGQQGKIKKLPGAVVLDQQTAQIVRNTIAAGKPPKPPVPTVTPPPRPVATPMPTPPKPPPSPPCTPYLHGND